MLELLCLVNQTKKVYDELARRDVIVLDDIDKNADGYNGYRRLILPYTMTVCPCLVKLELLNMGGVSQRNYIIAE